MHRIPRYHKIFNVFKKDNQKKLIEGRYGQPEFEYLKNNRWIFTEKINGANIRIMYNDVFHTVTHAGKTNNADRMRPEAEEYLDELTYSRQLLFQEVFQDRERDHIHPDQKLKEMLPRVCFYGEITGAKIQKGGDNYGPKPHFTLLDIWIDGWWLQRHDVESLGTQFEIPVVPIIGHGTLPDAISMCRTGFDSKWGDFKAEGIVARPVVELKVRNGNRVITKIKHEDFR